MLKIKEIRLCDWCEEETSATHHNEWVNTKGQRRQNDLCNDHQGVFLDLWADLEQFSSLARAKTAKRSTPRKPPTRDTIIRAWARQQGIPVNPVGKIPWRVEEAWLDAGSPNIIS